MVKLEEVLMTRITAIGELGQDFSVQIGGMANKLTEATKDSKGTVVLQKSDTDTLDTQAGVLATKLVPEIRAKMKQREKDGKKTNKAAWKSTLSESARGAALLERWSLGRVRLLCNDTRTLKARFKR